MCEREERSDEARRIFTQSISLAFAFTSPRRSNAVNNLSCRDTITDVVDPGSPEVLKRGWRRVVLFGLFFQPSAINIKDADMAFKERRPDINGDFLGIYPWDWVGDDKKSFKALTGGLLVAPILQKVRIKMYYGFCENFAPF